MRNIKENFSKGNFACRLAMLHLLARIISRHKLHLLEVYSFLMRYLNPSIRDVTQIFTVAAEACHERVPPEDL
jgi:protein SDA1